MAIHFSGFPGLNKPVVLAFPEIVVCLQCGLTEFTIPETELLVLRDGSITEDALILDLDAGSGNNHMSGKSAADEAPPRENGVDGGE